MIQNPYLRCSPARALIEAVRRRLGLPAIPEWDPYPATRDQRLPAWMTADAMDYPDSRPLRTNTGIAIPPELARLIEEARPEREARIAAARAERWAARRTALRHLALFRMTERDWINLRLWLGLMPQGPIARWRARRGMRAWLVKNGRSS